MVKVHPSFAASKPANSMSTARCRDEAIRARADEMSAQERNLQLLAASACAQEARLAEMHKALQARQEALVLKEAALAEREATLVALQSTQQAWCVEWH